MKDHMGKPGHTSHTKSTSKTMTIPKNGGNKNNGPMKMGPCTNCRGSNKK